MISNSAADVNRAFFWLRRSGLAIFPTCAVFSKEREKSWKGRFFFFVRAPKTPIKDGQQMKITALVLGILGGLAAGALGAKWVADINSPAGKQALAMADSPLVKRSPLLREEVKRLKAASTAGYLLLLSLGLGIAGGILTLRNKGKIGGAMLLVGAVLPAVFAPMTLIATFLLPIGAVFAFVAKPPRQAQAAAA
jgi:hypothetical protein